MGTQTGFELTRAERRIRVFSRNFKLQKVREIECGKSTVCQVCKQYEVSSTSVYRWMSTFGIMKDKKERLIVESQSDTQELLALKKRIADLERLVGQKQILLEFRDKQIEIAEEMYGVDIKKKLSTQLPGISGESGKNNPLA